LGLLGLLVLLISSLLRDSILDMESGVEPIMGVPRSVESMVFGNEIVETP
jgi:hypothetical protein